MKGLESIRLARRAAGGEWLRDALWPVGMAVLAFAVASAVQHVGLPPADALVPVLIAFVLVLLYLAALPLLRVGPGALLGLLLVVLCVALALWIGPTLALPAVALLAGHYTFLLRRAAHAEAGEFSGTRSDDQEKDRLLALALQGQGKLDEAFEKLRQLPIQGQVLGDLYYLGKGFVRRRAYDQAQAVFALLVEHAPGYRSAEVHLQRTSQLAKAAAQAAPADAKAAAPVAKKKGAPRRIGRYTIEGELGRGSMGVVYAARDPVIGRVVALKTLALSSEFEGHALVDARARFFREAESAGRLQHPNIVAIYDAGDEQGLAWIAMERLQGRDLSQFTESDQLLPVQVVASICARVADALDYAHQNQVVHRDIKPSNILFEAKTDGVKVTDFGIARITDNSRTRTGLVLGTPSFMAPEQIAGTKADGRCDIYALGVTMYQLLTGQLPLRGDSMSALMQAIARQVPADVRSLRPDVPASIAAIVARALDKNPGSRFQTGKLMSAELRVALAGLPPVRPVARVDYDARTQPIDQGTADFHDTVSEHEPEPAVPATRLRTR